jgi:hypothetical protein
MKRALSPHCIIVGKDEGFYSPVLRIISGSVFVVTKRAPLVLKNGVWYRKRELADQLGSKGGAKELNWIDDEHKAIADHKEYVIEHRVMH